MRLPIIVTLAAMLTTAVPVANASHEGPQSDCHGLAVVDVGGVAYVFLEALLSDGYLFSAWLVVESNGRPGCQYDDMQTL